MIERTNFFIIDFILNHYFMKKIFPVLLLLLLANMMDAQQTIRAFFAGNSYTASSNLPQLISDVAQSAGDTLIFSSNLMGGATLQSHATNPNTLEPIQVGNWDFVVIQAQSQEPSFPIGQVQSNTFPYAAMLNDSIEKYQPCGETMFFMTWGRENGDANNCPFFPPLCTYQGMDSLLRLRYEMMANDNDAVLSPVGAVWRYLRENHPTIDLYSPDGSHPSVRGSYAAACTFYAAMFREDPTQITFDFTLNAADALAIRNAAKVMVYDSLSTWNIGVYDVMADFMVSTVDSTDFTFTNLSINADSYLWDFGDGNVSTLENPTYTYSSNATYTVTLSAIKCGDTMTFSQDITAYIVNTERFLEDDFFRLSPNPTTDFVYIETEVQDFETYIYAQNGRFIGITRNENRIDLSNLPKGIYFIKIKFGDKSWEKQVMKY